MSAIPESHRDLIDGPLIASLSTVGPDGSPQVTAIWFVAEGHTVHVSIIATRQKFKNVVAHPQATLFVVDPKNPFRTLEIRGTVTVREDPDLELFAKVFRHYGQDPATAPAIHEGRVVISLTPTHVVSQG